MTLADCRILQLGDGLERRHHVPDGALGARVDVPRPHLLVEQFDVLAKPVAVDIHLFDVDFPPQRRLPVVDARADDEDEVPERLEQHRLTTTRAQLLVLGHVHLKQARRLQQARHHSLHRRQLRIVLRRQTIHDTVTLHPAESSLAGTVHAVIN